MRMGETSEAQAKRADGAGRLLHCAYQDRLVAGRETTEPICIPNAVEARDIISDLAVKTSRPCCCSA